MTRHISVLSAEQKRKQEKLLKPRTLLMSCEMPSTKWEVNLKKLSPGQPKKLNQHLRKSAKTCNKKIHPHPILKDQLYVPAAEPKMFLARFSVITAA